MRTLRRTIVPARISHEGWLFAGFPFAMFRLFHLRPTVAERRSVCGQGGSTSVQGRSRKGFIPHPVDYQ